MRTALKMTQIMMILVRSVLCLAASKPSMVRASETCASLMMSLRVVERMIRIIMSNSKKANDLLIIEPPHELMPVFPLVTNDRKPCTSA